MALALWPGGSPGSLAQEPKIGKQPVVITSDSLRHDEQGGRTIATGNVQVTQGGRTVRADRVVYDRRAGRVTALGNVSIDEPGGETVFGDRVVLSEDLRDGVIERFRMLFPDGTRLAANGATRTGGRKTEMAKVVFSPCKLCEEDPARAPLWRLKARRVIHDWKTRDIEYRDAWLEIYGLPVFYSPYFSHPDPTVERRSGFLAPTFGTGKQRGAWIMTPYYWRIGRDRDATVTPLISTRENPVLFMEYRERFEKGAIFLSGSYTSTGRPNPDVRPVSGTGRADTSSVKSVTTSTKTGVSASTGTGRPTTPICAGTMSPMPTAWRVRPGSKAFTTATIRRSGCIISRACGSTTAIAGLRWSRRISSTSASARPSRGSGAGISASRRPT